MNVRLGTEALDPIGGREVRREELGVLVDSTLVRRVGFVFVSSIAGGAISVTLYPKEAFWVSLGVGIGFWGSLYLVVISDIWKRYSSDAEVVYISLPIHFSSMA